MASATGNGSGKSRKEHGSFAPDCANPSQNNGAKSDINASGDESENPSSDPLTSLIRGEVIPRLMEAHSHEDRASNKDLTSTAARIEPAEAARFAPLPLAADADELMVEVEAFLERGVSAESIYVDLLAPSARRLGQLWETDACDFLDVTMGLWRLQEVMHEVARLAPNASPDRKSPPSALFCPIPGDDHSFGSVMLEEVFARAGWRSEILLEPRKRELLKIISETPYDLIGLTISNDCLSSTVADIITAIRSVSKSPTTKVIIGGRMVNAHPELVEQCGADGTAPDAISALALAERIVLETRMRVSSTA